MPELASSIDAHVAFNRELLPHVLFGDLTRFVIEAHAAGDSAVEARSLAFLDEMLRHGDEDVDNLVSVSFVENVGPWDPTQSDFIAHWPKALRAEAYRQRDWRPPRT